MAIPEDLIKLIMMEENNKLLETVKQKVLDNVFSELKKLTLGIILPHNAQCTQRNNVPNGMKNAESSYFLNTSLNIYKVNKRKSISQKYPLVCLKDVFSTQGQVSKEEFLNYHNLQGNVTQEIKSTDKVPIYLKRNSDNIPFSSNLGIKIFPLKFSVDESYQLKKIERFERYVNKPYLNNPESVKYPITYRERNVNSHTYKFHRNSPYERHLKRVEIVLEKIDINAYKEKSERTLKVVVPFSEKKMVDDRVLKLKRNMVRRRFKKNKQKLKNISRRKRVLRNGKLLR